MTTDTGLDLGTMIKIVRSLRGLSSQSVQFVQVPSLPYPLNNNWVQWSPQASTLFAAIAHDKTLPKITRKRAAGTAPQLAAVPPSPVGVLVLNGSGIAGIAGQAADDLTRAGFHVVGTSDAPTFGFASSVVEYASHADLPAARALKARVKGAVLQKDPSLTAGTVDLIVGSSFTGVRPPAPHRSTSASVGDLAGKYGGITGSARACRDSSAFTGPDGGS
jgi:hypothetical protein